MAVTAGMVKELREITGAGMMDCKKALAETNGDMDAAVEYLRKNGQAKAERKAGRLAAEGVVFALLDGDNRGTIVEVNSETDFVAKNEEFQTFVADVAAQAIDSSSTDIDTFLTEAWKKDASKTVKDVLVEKIAVIGENLAIRRFYNMSAENGCVVSYIHGGGRIGVLVKAETDKVNDGVKEALVNIAMQIAALSAKYISKEDITEEYKAHEMEILVAQAKNDPKNANKPENIIEKMVAGRLDKELKELCLLDQDYVKDSENNITVAQYLASIAKAENCTLTIKEFVRFETGEGLEKKEENFAEEVAKQMGSN